MRKVDEFADMPRNVVDEHKRSGHRNCKISCKDEMISCQNIKRCRSCRVCRIKRSSARRLWASGLKKNGPLRIVFENSWAKMEFCGPATQEESLVEVELDLEIRGLQAEMKGEVAVHPVQWVLLQSNHLQQFLR